MHHVIKFLTLTILFVSCKSSYKTHKSNAEQIIQLEIISLDKNTSYYVLDEFGSYLLKEFNNYLLNFNDLTDKEHYNISRSIIHDIKNQYIFNETKTLDSIEVVNYIKQLSNLNFKISSIIDLTNAKIQFINNKELKEYYYNQLVKPINKKRILVFDKPIFTIDNSYCLTRVNNRINIYNKKKKKWILIESIELKSKEF